jgi:hypothetical protein
VQAILIRCQEDTVCKAFFELRSLALLAAMCYWLALLHPHWDPAMAVFYVHPSQSCNMVPLPSFADTELLPQVCASGDTKVQFKIQQQVVAHSTM